MKRKARKAKVDPKDVKRLVELFWDNESLYGAPTKAKTTARRLQKALGYTTPYDDARRLRH